MSCTLASLTFPPCFVPFSLPQIVNSFRFGGHTGDTRDEHSLALEQAISQAMAGIQEEQQK